MKCIHNYQSITVGYIDGKFINASLFISIDHDGETICEHYLTITDFGQAMKTLRSLEKRAGKAARMMDFDGWTNKHQYQYTGKFLTLSDMRFE